MEKYAAIYSGLWGYNTALTAAAIAVTFYVPSLLSSVNAAFAIVFTAATQLAVSNALSQVTLKCTYFEKFLMVFSSIRLDYPSLQFRLWWRVSYSWPSAVGEERV